jgi:hypothetical protein
MIAEWYMVMTLLAKDRGGSPVVQRFTGFVSQQNCEDFAKIRWREYWNSVISNSRYLDTLCKYDNGRLSDYSRIKCDQNMTCTNGHIPY